MKMHPFGSAISWEMARRFAQIHRLKGTRWEMRGVDRGPDNDFTVVDAGLEEVYCITSPCPQPTFVLYRKTDSDDEPTKRYLDDFESNFMPYGTEVTDLGKMTVTAKRPSGGVPWWLLAAGAALLLS